MVERLKTLEDCLEAPKSSGELGTGVWPQSPRFKPRCTPDFGPFETPTGPVICGVAEGPHKAEADDGPTKCRKKPAGPESCLGRVSATIPSLRSICEASPSHLQWKAKPPGGRPNNDPSNWIPLASSARKLTSLVLDNIISPIERVDAIHSPPDRTDKPQSHKLGPSPDMRLALRNSEGPALPACLHSSKGSVA
ncbi:hypothetical protein CSIM01_05388 [Colletotrichum simmondsii]|uniref:Uncharacterized protein n=1 Tax=Colletotrichum simmondsii TaxID=703756 RepID=A0A135TQ52_9PEZI|nr:hypothetical protein CSIM01_05388 [Colletotrichum simmondsii]